METEALERPADLKVFRHAAAGFGPAVRFGTLREAIFAAGRALARPATEAWIVTEEGDMLSPVWIRTYLG
ncbi:hypothetical protein [Methylobacterium sp. A54F]